jgi:cytochrome b subunit of formate dehydrogenase
MKRTLIALALVVSGAWLAASAVRTAGSAKALPELKGWKCEECHGTAADGIPAVTMAGLEKSVHSGLECTDCHRDVSELPHSDRLQKVNCGNCHTDESAEYTHHGRGIKGETEDLPSCADCHGSHDVLPASDPKSKVNPQNLPETCGHCHSNLDLAQKHDILLTKAVATYESSVHGAHAPGANPAATCIDCHSATGTGHQILGVGYAESSINHFKIPETCGKCHGTIRDQYLEGIHGQLLLRGDTHTPVCTDCHGEHGILRVDDPRSNVSPTLVAEATCVPCHQSARLNNIYGVPAGRLTSFVDSYHGLKSMEGDVTVANCASCHGSHLILPSSDPRSTINPANLQKTCGRCHPAITAQFAQTPIHNLTGSSNRWTGLVRKIYLILITLVIGGMAVYVLLDYRKSLIEVMKKADVRRMSGNAIFQHTLLAVSFIVLVLTGFALRYSEAWFFRHVFGWDGGFRVRGIVHRVAAVIFLFSTFWHVVYLRSPEGRAFFSGMLPKRSDGRELWQTGMFLVGRRGRRPRYGKFSFVEKAEYWALVWGTGVMALTGLLLWFDGIALRLFAKPALDVFRVIHLYEAWLAALAILIWHFYSTVFKPGVYPGNPAWLNGRMPAEMYEEEHPGDLLPEREGDSAIEHEEPTPLPPSRES